VLKSPCLEQLPCAAQPSLARETGATSRQQDVRGPTSRRRALVLRVVCRFNNETLFLSDNGQAVAGTDGALSDRRH